MLRFEIYFQDMDYCPVSFLVQSGQTDGQTDGQKVTHMSPPCKVHSWAQRLQKSVYQHRWAKQSQIRVLVNRRIYECGLNDDSMPCHASVEFEKTRLIPALAA